MKKSILKLKGAQELTKNEQKSINGGRANCRSPFVCPPNNCCYNYQCYPFGSPQCPLPVLEA